MSTLRHSKMTDRGYWQRGFAVLAFLALSILLVHPVCDAAQDSDKDHSAHHESRPCSVSLAEASLIPGAGPVAPPGKGSAEPLPQATASLKSAIAAPWRSAEHRWPRPRRSLPYHARSARILA
jgi:hypothetical protein